MARTAPDPDEQHARQKAAQQHSQTTGVATQRAAEDMPRVSELQSREFIETAFDPDANRGDGVEGIENNHIEEKFAAEFSRHRGLGNITREEWNRREKMNRARALLAKQEMARPNGLGSKCSRGIREAWTGVDEGLPERRDDMAREIDEVFEEKSLLESLSINARGFRGLTEVTAVTRSEGTDAAGGGSGGLVSRASSFLFGG